MVFNVAVWFLVLLALFPFVLVHTESSSVVGVACLLVRFCRLSLFYLCFIFVLVMLVMFCFFLLLFVVLTVASPPGEGTRSRPDGGARQWFFRKPGVFFLPPVGVFSSFLCSLFYFFFGVYIFLHSSSCSFSLYISFYFVCFFLLDQG